MENREPQLLDIKKMDLDRHGVIEASAGTGKTYTVQHLVTRLIAEQNIDISSILVVTYTEKAAGELRERIRQSLIDNINRNGEIKYEYNDEQIERLQNALNSYDRSEIHTIHGFCNSLINDYSFDNKLFFSNTIVDDGEISLKILHEIMRTDWPDTYKEMLTDLLIISNVNESWEKSVINLSYSYNEIETVGYSINPPYNADFYHFLQQISEKNVGLWSSGIHLRSANINSNILLDALKKSSNINGNTINAMKRRADRIKLFIQSDISVVRLVFLMEVFLMENQRNYLCFLTLLRVPLSKIIF